jgi:methylenetetrahydrofolate--tRNA-(uracil-5-)-methyltransferase
MSVMNDHVITILGGGLAGCEAAWRAAQAGLAVELVEMRPVTMTPAHQTDRLAELVCSNSLKSESLDDASGLLKQEMRSLGSLVLSCAERHRVPAGSALAVDRVGFAEEVTRVIQSHPLIRLVRREATGLPAARPLIVATGPLTSDRLAADLAARFAAFLETAFPEESGILRTGGSPSPSSTPISNLQPRTSNRSTANLLSFYDAISPIVAADSIDDGVVFRAARYGKGGADYLNCPFTRDEYRVFREALLAGERYPIHAFEDHRYFEGCLPIEELAERGEDALRFGPMRPVGLKDPRTGKRPFAVVQLRQEDRGARGRPTMYNLVGFQTRLRRSEQARAIRLVPGLRQAEILRYGSVHRNTFVLAPKLLEETLQFRGAPGVFFAGQLTGVEGYLESSATGILAGINAARQVRGEPLVAPPPDTMLGGLLHYLTTAHAASFQPINANFGLLPSLSTVVTDRQDRNRCHVERATKDFGSWCDSARIPTVAGPE